MDKIRSHSFNFPGFNPTRSFATSNKTIFVVIFTLVLTIFTFTSSSFADLPPVLTDKKFYNTGDTIIIYGQVNNFSPDVPVAIRIIDPQNNFVSVAQVNVNAEGIYSVSVPTATGGLIRTSGTYTVIVSYGNNSELGTTSFDFNAVMPPPTITANPPGGTYSTSQTVTLTSDHQATIYYTTDGSDPTTSSPSSTSPLTLTISQTTSLKFFAVDAAGNKESVKTENYSINTTSSTTIAEVGGGIAAAAVTGIVIAIKLSSGKAVSAAVKATSHSSMHSSQHQQSPSKSTEQNPQTLNIIRFEMAIHPGIEKE